MSKTALWDRVCRTDPQAVKAITGKQYQGNSPKPYYIVRRLTEEFGPCGTGWGFTILSERMERLTDKDVLHIAAVRLWYIDSEGKRGEFDQMGQTKAVYAKKDGGLMVDEDAPKKSVTDALVKCASYLGFAGDIFSGRWDDSKYVAELKQEFERPKAISAEQVEEITKLIDSTNTDVGGLLDWVSEKAGFTVERLEQAPENSYKHIVAALNKKQKAAA